MFNTETYIFIYVTLNMFVMKNFVSYCVSVIIFAKKVVAHIISFSVSRFHESTTS